MIKLKLFIVGLIIGIGKIIPGVSGAIFALLFGVYEDIIECISNPFKIGKKLNKIIPLCLGIVFAIIFGSNFIKILLDKCYVEAIFYFLGMMIFGLISLIKEAKTLKPSKSSIFISFFLVMLVTIFFIIDFNNSAVVHNSGLRKFISLLLCGIIDAASAIIPGVSGTAILIILGYYETIITNLALMSSVSTFMIGFITLIPFFIGMGMGLILISKLVDYLFKNYEAIMKLSVIGFTLVSMVLLFLEVNSFINYHNIIYLVLLSIMGFITSYILEYKLVSKV